MPPKVTAVSQDQFLAVCFMNCTEKPRVDFDKVAALVGMSTGGAANKYRAIMKKHEDDLAAAGLDKDSASASGSVPKTPVAKRKASIKKAASLTTSADADDDVDSVEKTSEEERPKKRGRPAKKGKNTPAKKSNGRGKQSTIEEGSSASGDQVTDDKADGDDSPGSALDDQRVEE